MITTIYNNLWIANYCYYKIIYELQLPAYYSVHIIFQQQHTLLFYSSQQFANDYNFILKNNTLHIFLSIYIYILCC